MQGLDPLFRGGGLIRSESLYSQPDRCPISLNKMLPLERQKKLYCIHMVTKHYMGFPGEKIGKYTMGYMHDKITLCTV